MPYTVKQLATLSGISVRTLHHYDDIGLLAPAYVGDNRYRYYEEEQLLLLQQILFYRELGFPLNEIQKIVCSDSFDKIEALESHKQLLQGDLDRVNTLIKTIDNTIAHLKGDNMVNLEAIFDGFSSKQQQFYEDYLVESGVDRNTIAQSKKRVKHWSKKDWEKNKADNDAVLGALVEAIENGLSPSSQAVQALIQQHYDLTCIFWTPTKDTYISLGQMYKDNPAFAKFYNNIHPQLLDFLIDAMTQYANAQLT